MNCPICGNYVEDGTNFCTACGARMSSFAGVSPDKIIVNQTPEEQMAIGDDTDTHLMPENYQDGVGDDSVTQLIPENYMKQQGDDSVTQLIPENYMQVQGDDGVTQFIPENHLDQYDAPKTMMPTWNEPQKPAFQQQMQTPNIQQPQMGFQLHQTQMQPNMQQPMAGPVYQQPQPMAGPVYQQPAMKPAVGIAASNKTVSVITVAILALAMVIAVIVAMKPLFYYTQSYVGSVYNNNATLQRFIMMEDPDGELDGMLKIVCFAVTGLYFLALLLSVAVMNKAKNATVKPAVKRSLLAFLLTALASGFMIFFDSFTREELGNDYDGMEKFNIYNVFIIACVVVAVATLINFFAAMAAKSKWKKNRY